ncbi:D-alanine--D-alanine ligase family protein [Leptospira jelokensis]|uniref:D-alanine--D-alanine ligase n=1 Tax=Leptospira jelokensis TaxID=2484931 RepID=A0A4Z0ZWJ5_9LEPT|nr:D-alanine--D-alanine ligase [Leptospira jelokensis]TGL61338.1 D-alanine--D-alanine ligase [Leptospira jelokensis]
MKTVLLACDIYNPKTPKLSQEWESEETISMMEKTIKDLGYDVVSLNDATEITSALAGIPKTKRGDWIVWNLIEGYSSYSREAYIPALCEYLAIPHTGSDASVQTLTLNKQKTKLFLQSFGICTPDSQLLTEMETKPYLPFPIFIKPNGEGSSLGISEENHLRSIEEWNVQIPKRLLEYSEILAEPYLSGRELTVAVIGNFGSYQVLPIAYVDTPSGIYHEGIKSKSEFLETLDFGVDPSLSEPLKKTSLAVAKYLRSSGYIRIDYKLENKIPYLMEVNATPGFSPIYSTLPLLWEKTGKTYSELLKTCLELGFEEYKNHKRFQYGKDQL